MVGKMNILIVSLEEFRNLFQNQIDVADLVIIDQGDSAYIYKNRYDAVSQYKISWEQASRLIINTLSRKHVIYLPDIRPA